jgi:hypothetical protein
MKDTFDYGHLERVLPDGTTLPLTGTVFLQPAGTHGGDVDGDGVADPIFFADTSGARTRTTIDLTAASELNPRNWVVERSRKTILCQNDLH